jgi:hypothetical protein
MAVVTLKPVDPRHRRPVRRRLAWFHRLTLKHHVHRPAHVRLNP